MNFYLCMLLFGAGAAPSEDMSTEPTQEAIKLCAADVRLCPDGKTHVARDPKNNCQFKTCPDESSKD